MFMKKYCSESESCSLMSNSATPWIIHIQSMEFSRPEYWSGQPFPSPRDLPNPGIKSRSPLLQADSLPVEPQGKPKNTGVCSLSLFQGIFPTQESNRDILNCRQILYQLNYQGSPDKLNRERHISQDLTFILNLNKQKCSQQNILQFLQLSRYGHTQPESIDR